MVNDTRLRGLHEYVVLYSEDDGSDIRIGDKRVDHVTFSETDTVNLVITDAQNYSQTYAIDYIQRSNEDDSVTVFCKEPLIFYMYNTVPTSLPWFLQVKEFTAEHRCVNAIAALEDYGKLLLATSGYDAHKVELDVATTKLQLAQRTEKKLIRAVFTTEAGTRYLVSLNRADLPWLFSVYAEHLSNISELEGVIDVVTLLPTAIALYESKEDGKY